MENKFGSVNNFLKHEQFLNVENKFWNGEQIWKCEFEIGRFFETPKHNLKCEQKEKKRECWEQIWKLGQFLKARTIFECWEQILKWRTNLEARTIFESTNNFWMLRTIFEMKNKFRSANFFLKHEQFLNVEKKFWNGEQI